MKKLAFAMIALPLCLSANGFVNTNRVFRDDVDNMPMYLTFVVRSPDGAVKTNYQKVVSHQGRYIAYDGDSNYSLMPDPAAWASFDEMKMRVNVLWTDYTNRMERISRMQQRRAERQKARPRANVPPDSPLRFAKPSRAGRRVK